MVEIIIRNYLGDNKAATSLVNKLNIHDSWSSINPNHNRIYKQLNDFYEKPWHKWKATLRHQYFSTPWRIASTVAAIILLVFTFIQTVCSIIQIVPIVWLLFHKFVRVQCVQCVVSTWTHEEFRLLKISYLPWLSSTFYLNKAWIGLLSALVWIGLLFAFGYDSLYECDEKFYFYGISIFIVYRISFSIFVRRYIWTLMELIKAIRYIYQNSASNYCCERIGFPSK